MTDPLVASAIPAPEFSRPVAVARITRSPAQWRPVANEGERKALSQRFDLISISRLEGVATLERVDGGCIRLEASLDADVVQSCVVTLEPVPATVHDDFVLVFTPGIDDEEADRLVLDDPYGDLIEPMPPDVIDLGEILAQQLSIVLDPFPRAPHADAHVPPLEDPETDAPPTVRSLAALARLKPGSGES